MHAHMHLGDLLMVRKMLGFEEPCFNSWGEILSYNVKPGNGSSPDTFMHTRALGVSPIVGC